MSTGQNPVPVKHNKIYQKVRKWVANGVQTGYPFMVSVITRGSC